MTNASAMSPGLPTGGHQAGRGSRWECLPGNETLSLVSYLPSKPRYELTAKRHPLGVVGVAQCVELIQPLRGVAVSREGDARNALAHNLGGPTAMSAATILEGPGADGC
jgi:acetyl-CoA C-acetyltransferase